MDAFLLNYLVTPHFCQLGDNILFTQESEMTVDFFPLSIKKNLGRDGMDAIILHGMHLVATRSNMVTFPLTGTSGTSFPGSDPMDTAADKKI